MVGSSTLPPTARAPDEHFVILPVCCASPSWERHGRSRPCPPLRCGSWPTTSRPTLTATPGRFPAWIPSSRPSASKTSTASRNRPMSSAWRKPPATARPSPRSWPRSTRITTARPIYATSPFQATEAGNNPGSGNGPNSVIYNTLTLTLVDSEGVGTPTGSSGNGESRQIARYEFMPVGGTAANVFYVYVSHMKSSFGGETAGGVGRPRVGGGDPARRRPPRCPHGTRVRPAWAISISAAAPRPRTRTSPPPAARGRGSTRSTIIPRTTPRPGTAPTYAAIDTESDTSIQYRDDIQFVSASAFNGTVSGGLEYLAGSYRAFGNNGTTAFRGSVNSMRRTPRWLICRVRSPPLRRWRP